MNNNPGTNSFAQPSSEAVWRGLAGLLLLTMETLWFAVWYDGLTGSPAAWWGKLFFLWITLLVSQTLTRRAQRLKLTVLRRQILFLGWITLVLLASLRLLFFAGQPVGFFKMLGLTVSSFGTSPAGFRIYWHVLIILLAIGRGVLLGNQTVNRGNSAHSFQFGLILFLIYGLFLGHSKPLESLILLFAYLAAGLLTLSFARIADLGSTYGGRLPKFSRRWVLSILLSVTGVILLTGLAAVVVNQQVTNAIAEVLLALVAAFMAVVIFLLSPILAFILEQIFRFGQRIFANVPDIIQESAAESAAEQALENSEESVRLLTDLVNKSLPLILVAILLVVIVLVILQLRKNRSRLEYTGVEDQAESTPTRRPRLRMPFGAPGGLGKGRFRPGRMIAAARIRRTYAQLMTLCEKLEIPRSPAVTPLEFLPTMLDALPDRGDDLSRITTAYQKVRYGEIPETSQEVQDVLAAWERVRQAGKASLIRHRQDKAHRAASKQR